MSATDSTSSSREITLPPVPPKLRDRKPVFGYLVNNEFMRNYYAKQGEEHDFSESAYDYFDNLIKREIMEDAAREAGCSMSTVHRTSREDSSEDIILAFFASYAPPYITITLPTVEELETFKRHLCLNEDPQWISSSLQLFAKRLALPA